MCSRMDWGYVPRFGFKGAIFEHLYQLSRISSSHGSHYDQVHSGAMMIVTEDVSCRSNHYVSVTSLLTLLCLFFKSLIFPFLFFLHNCSNLQKFCVDQNC